jgi:membrane dipeptidase
LTPDGPFFFDAHLDLAMNALEWNRDLTRSIAEIRAAERGRRDKPGRGRGTVSLPELRRAGVGLVVATQIGRVADEISDDSVAVWHSAAQAWAMTQAQWAWYRALEEAGEIKIIASRAELEQHAALWRNGETSVIGCVLSLEGADSLITIGHLERAHAGGLRAIGLAHYGPGRYAQGTNATGGLPPAGRQLLKEIERLGMILDLTHLSDECFWEALASFSGPVWASHHNCRALVPHQRQLSDDQIRALIERDAVIGVVLDAWMLVPGWVRGETMPQTRGLRLAQAVEHIDHVCQIAGNARHVGLGSDLDGGFGNEQTPCDLDTIADVRRLLDLLGERGWKAEDLTGFAHGNFLRVLSRAFG